MAVPRNFDARRFEDAHQAQSLAGWSGGVVVPGPWIAWRDGALLARPGGDWIILGDGMIRIDPPGNQDGYCADCGLPVWWRDVQLVTKPGVRWCYGPDGKRLGMTHWHALPGMDQYIVPAAEGTPCHCLARDYPHIHQIVPVPEFPEQLPEGWRDRKTTPVLPPGWHDSALSLDPGDGSMPDGSLPY